MNKEKILCWLPFKEVITSFHNLVIKAASVEASERNMELIVCSHYKSENYRLQRELEEFTFETKNFTSLFEANKQLKPVIIYCEDSVQITIDLIGNPNTRVVTSRVKAEEFAKEIYLKYLNGEKYITHSIAEKIHLYEEDAQLAYGQ